MKSGYYWGRLKSEPDSDWEPLMVDEYEEVWFFQEEFHPCAISDVEFDSELIPPKAKEGV